jgi:choline-sulfatase
MSLVSNRPLCLPLFAILLLIAGCRKAETVRGPCNVVLITIDTIRADHVGAYGDRRAATPNIDALAKEGVRFDQAISPVPLTLPAHASILSSTLPLHHGVRNNGGNPFPANRETLAGLFRQNRYRTAAFVGAFVLDHRFGLDRGFDVYDDAIPRNPAATSQFDAERRGGEVVDRALGWLQQKDSRPFFAWVHLYDAHAPYDPPEPYRSRFSQRLYDGEIAYVDEQIGRIVAEVRREGVERQTIIALVGDHGEALGEHGELTHGLLLYEPTLRVPLIITAPGLLPPSVVHQPTSTVDLATTLSALAGCRFPDGNRDGRDLSGALRKGSEPPVSTSYSETEYPKTFGWSGLSAVRRGSDKLIASPDSELFDLAADPGETRNLLAGKRRVYFDLQRILAALQSGAVASQPVAVDPETRSKLASLGYVAPTAGTSNPSSSLADPKRMAPLFRKFEEANWALNDGKPEAAIGALREIVAADPRNAVFRASLARALRQAGKLSDAVPLYREAVALAPEDPEAWYNLAVALQEAGLLKEASTAVREAIRRDPRRPEAHNALGIAYSDAGDLVHARDEFERALEIDPRDARAWNNLGNVYRSGGQYDQAVAAFSRAISLAPTYADPLNGLGVVEVQRDRPAAAIPHFDRALVLAPDFYEAQLNRGIALQMAGNRRGAAEQFESLLRRLPSGRQNDQQRKAATVLLRRLSVR